MLLSTQTDVLTKLYGEKAAVEMIAAAGFDAVDYSQFDIKTDEGDPESGKNYEKFASELRKIADGCGVVFNQSHAPFPSYIESDPKRSEEMLCKTKRSIEIALLLGAKQICVHPVTFPNDEEREFEFNLEFYNSFVPLFKGSGMKIGVENMWWNDRSAGALRPGACGTSQRMKRLFDALDSKYFTCLLDIGHCGLAGESPERFITELGGTRLGALHVHDNDFKSDMHALPFTRSINWKSVTAALAEIGYAGEFTFEADNFLKSMPEEIVPQALGFLHTVGRQLISMIEAHKNAEK